MPQFSPQLLAGITAGAWQPEPGAVVTGVSLDTRTLQRGDLFVALRTEKRDGHDFVAAAAAAGAAAALVSRPVPDVALPQLVVRDPLAALHALARAHRRQFRGRVIAVTGTAGKTSTKDLLFTLLGRGGEILATTGNLNNHLGVPLTLLRLDPGRHHVAVVEAGISAPGEMDLIGSLILPEVAVITNVGAAHLEGLGSVAGVAREKARLAAHVAPGGVVAFPAACLVYPEFRALAPRALVAVDAAASGPPPPLPPAARRVDYAARAQGANTHLRLTIAGGHEEFVMPRVTAGMAGNAAIALAVLLELGVPADALRLRLPLWRPAALRGEVRESGGRTLYVDCYNANPVSMSDALEGFLELSPAAAPRLFVIGCMEELGADAETLHRAAGERWPLREGDTLLVFGQHAPALAAGARRVAPGADIRINPDRGDARRMLREFRGSIFVKGSRRHALETLLDDDQAGAGDASCREVAA